MLARQWADSQPSCVSIMATVNWPKVEPHSGPEEVLNWGVNIISVGVSINYYYRPTKPISGIVEKFQKRAIFRDSI